MKLLFIFHEDENEPPSFPLGAGLLSSVIKREGHETTGIFFHADPEEGVKIEELVKDVAKISPDLICYSFNSVSLDAIKIIASELKTHFSIPSIAGGVHATLYPEETAEIDGIDYVCRGDGERCLVEVVNRLESGKECLDIAGIYANRNGKTIMNQMHSELIDLDSLPNIDYDLFGAEVIKKQTSDGWLRYITSRGCPYNCSYCHIKMLREAYSEGMGVSAGKVGFIRFRSVDLIIDEMIEMSQKYNLKVVNFMDDLFALKKERTLEFCRKFKERAPESLGYSIQTHLEQLDGDVVETLRGSRCLRIVVGVESGNNRILKLLKRDTNLDKMKVRLASLVNAKFPLGTWTLNMIGNPTETKAEMIDTLAFNASALADTVKINMMAPYPGSEIYDYCVDNKLFRKEPSGQNIGDRYEETKLLFPEEERAFLEKFFDVGHWYMNIHAPLNVGKYYHPLIEEVEKVSFGKWPDVKDRFMQMDQEVSEEIRREGLRYYDFIYKGKVSGKAIGLVG